MSSLKQIHQESNEPCSKLGLPLHHELPPGLEPFVHAGVVALVQRGSSCYHEFVVHLGASLAVERRVEPRCRRCFCRRPLLLIPLIHGSEVRSQFERPILACRSPVCRLLQPARAVLSCLSLRSSSALAVQGFLFQIRVSPPFLAAVDVRSTAGCPLPSVPVRLQSTWLLGTHAVPPAVSDLFKYPRSIRAAIAAADRLPRFREATRITAPLPCCVCTHCDVLLMHSFAHQRGSLCHDVSHSNRTTTSTVNTTLCPDRKKETCLHIAICACHPQLIKILKPGLGSCHDLSSVMASQR